MLAEPSKSHLEPASGVWTDVFATAPPTLRHCQTVTRPITRIDADLSRETGGRVVKATVIPAAQPASPNAAAGSRTLRRRSSLAASPPLHPSFRPLPAPPSPVAAALVRQAHSGPQPLLAALSEVDVSAAQLRSISCEGAVQTAAQPTWIATLGDAYCQPPQLRQPPQQQIPPQMPPSPQQHKPECSILHHSFADDAAPVAAAAAATTAAPHMRATPAALTANNGALGGVASDPREWHRSVVTACGSPDPDICLAARMLEATLDDELAHRLRVACSQRHLGAVAAVLGAGADVHSRDAAGRTAVHALAAAPCPPAAAPAAARILDLLLSYGARLWARDARGATPLHLAASRPMMEVLLAAAAARASAGPGVPGLYNETKAEAMVRAAYKEAGPQPPVQAISRRSESLPNWQSNAAAAAAASHAAAVDGTVGGDGQHCKALGALPRFAASAQGSGTTELAVGFPRSVSIPAGVKVVTGDNGGGAIGQEQVASTSPPCTPAAVAVAVIRSATNDTTS